MSKEITKDYLLREYVEKKRSSEDIAKENGTYAMKILRLLQKYDIPKRTNSEAQVATFEKGRESPFKGRKLTPEQKKAISDRVAKTYKDMTPDEKASYAARSKANWEKLSEEQKQEMFDKSRKAIRETLKEGSKAERLIRDALRVAGYRVEFLKTDILTNKDLEIDIFLPDRRIGIEIDGPAHYTNIYGEESFNRYQRADKEKDRLMVHKGYHLIRVRLTGTHLSQFRERILSSAVIEKVKSIKPTDIPSVHILSEEELVSV